jgi:aminoglycoside 6'-N-acetyltransferase
VNPWTFAEPLATARLVLRPFELTDAPAVHAWMSDPEVARYQSYEPRTVSEVESVVAEFAAARSLGSEGDFIQPAIVVDGDVVGALYLVIRSATDRTVELGWSLRADRQRRGYATEAVRAILDLAFGALGAHRAVAELDPRNDASVALCERVGMRREAHLVENYWFKGTWADTLVYAILDREWHADGVRDAGPAA